MESVPWIVLAGAVLFCVRSGQRPQFDPGVVPRVVDANIPQVPALPDRDLYQTAFATRNIFKPWSEDDQVRSMGIPAVSLRVVGLILGNTRSVVLEDVQGGRHVILSEGQEDKEIRVCRISSEGIDVEVSGRALHLETGREAL